MHEYIPQIITTPWGELELADEADVRRCLASKQLLAACETVLNNWANNNLTDTVIKCSSAIAACNARD